METKELLLTVKSIVDAHREFKEAYNSRLAFDFNVLNFFNVGENKTSEILAFFLNPNESHGQGTAFLAEFVSLLCDEDIVINDVEVICEKRIDNDRRIDLYVKLKDWILAIENKIWARDQPNQLKDYSTFLEKESKGMYQLFYLKPFKSDPDPMSIDKALKEQLEDEGKLKVISYTTEIAELLKRWQGMCKADSVTWFLRQFELHLKSRFQGNQTINIQKKMEKLVKEHQEEVQKLVQTYKEIEEQLLNKIDKIAKKYKQKEFNFSNDVFFEKQGPFSYKPNDKNYDRTVYKIGISRGTDKLWIQIFKENLRLFSHHYFEKETSEEFKWLFDKKLNYWIEIDEQQDNPEHVFEQQLQLALDVLEKEKL